MSDLTEEERELVMTTEWLDEFDPDEESLLPTDDDLGQAGLGAYDAPDPEQVGEDD